MNDEIKISDEARECGEAIGTMLKNGYSLYPAMQRIQLLLNKRDAETRELRKWLNLFVELADGETLISGLKRQHQKKWDIAYSHGAEEAAMSKETKAMTDPELQLALAKMLPEKIDYLHNFAAKGTEIYWLETLQRIQDTEWLHVCWLIEQGMNVRERSIYTDELGGTINQSPYALFHKSWQQRAQALITTLGETKGAK